MSNISKEDFFEWLSNPVTKKVMGSFLLKKQEEKDRLGNGRTISSSSNVTAMNTAGSVGYIRGLDEMLTFTQDDIDAIVG